MGVILENKMIISAPGDPVVQFTKDDRYVVTHCYFYGSSVRIRRRLGRFAPLKARLRLLRNVWYWTKYRWR